MEVALAACIMAAPLQIIMVWHLLAIFRRISTGEDDTRYSAD
jgi:hypothetical protein